MILTRPMIHALLSPKAREIRFPDDYPHLPDQEGHGEVVPITVAPGRDPVAWVLIENSWHDDDTSEYVYEIRKVPAPDTPRLLTPAGRPKGSELGYTDKPYLSMIDEPEAVDRETQDRLTLAAIGRDTRRRREQSIAARRDRELLTIVERINLAKQAARQHGIAIHAEVKAITRMRERGRSEGLVQAELERVERIVYRDAA